MWLYTSATLYGASTRWDGLDCLGVPFGFPTTIGIEIRSQVKRDYPLNLSILIRGGKENNHDTLSNGE